MKSESPGAIMMRPGKKIDLDKINRKILQILIEDSRTPISHIAKLVNLSKAGVLKRINRMLEERVIYDFTPLINPIAFGYQMYLISLSTELSYEDEDIASIKRCPYIWWLLKVSGNHNLSVILAVRDPKAFHDIWGHLSRKLHIRDWEYSMIDYYGIKPYELLDVKSGLQPKTRSETLIKMDRIDAEILNIIRFDARASLHRISVKTGFTTDKIKNRLRTLYDSGVIQVYFTNFDIFSLGLTPYMLFLKIKDPLAQPKIIRFIHESKHSNGIVSLLNEWSVMACVQFHSIQEFRVFIEDLLKRFPQIASYQTAIGLDQIVADTFPQGVYQDFLKGSE